MLYLTDFGDQKLSNQCAKTVSWRVKSTSRYKQTRFQGWGQLHNINSTPTPTPEVSTPTPASLQNINPNSNSGGFNSNSNSNSGKSPKYQLRFQLQLRRFQLQFQLQLRSFKSNPNSISNPILLVQLNYLYPITIKCEILHELNEGVLLVYVKLSKILDQTGQHWHIRW